MEFAFITGKVHSFFRQFFGRIGNLLVYCFELVFCGGLSAGEVVRIPGFVGQFVNSSIFPVDFHFSGIDVSCRAVNGDFISGFDNACCAVDGYLFGRIASQCHLVFETNFIVSGTIRINSWRNSNIIAGSYGSSCSRSRFIQLRFINCIFRICTISYIGNLIAAVVKAVFGQGYGVSGRSVIDRNAVIIHDCIAGCHAFKTFQGFGETDFQVIASVRYDADVIICRQFGCVCNATDDVHLFVQFLLDDCSRITAVLHAVIQGSHFFIGSVRFLVYDTGRGRTRCTVYPGLAVTGNGDICRYAVFSVDADFSVFAVFTCGHDCFDFKVFIHLHVDCRISGRVLRDKGFKVFSAVIVIGSRAFPFNGDLGA